MIHNTVCQSYKKDTLKVTIKMAFYYIFNNLCTTKH